MIYRIISAPGIQIRAIRVPGGVVVITDTYQEDAIALATSFVPMTDAQASEFLGEDEE